MNNNFAKFALRNSFIGAMVFIIQMFVGFITRFFFIKYLGVELLGLNGLFTNILMILSLAELGIGPALVYSLYKPLALKDTEIALSLMAFYRKVYNIIGVVIAFLGIILLPFLHLILKNNQNIDGVYIYYILFLLNTVVSYFFTFKRSIIIADQKNYIVSLNDFFFWILFQVLSTIGLFYYRNYTFYLSFQILCTLMGNISISRKADEEYPFLKQLKSSTIPIPKELKEEIKKNTLGQFSSKIGYMVVVGTDNILISIFIGLVDVGLYNNYSLIISSLNALVNQVTGSVTATIGNFKISSDVDEGINVFKIHNFLSYTIAYFFSTFLLVLINPFITIWLGQNFQLSFLTAFIMVLNFAVGVTRKSALSFIDAYGLAWFQRHKSIIEAILNLVISLILVGVLDLGLNGILLGTLLSSLLIPCWYEPYILFKYGFNKKFADYFRTLFKNLVLLLTSFLISLIIVKLFQGQDGILFFILRIIVTLLATSIIYIIQSFNRKEFKSLIKVIKRKI